MSRRRGHRREATRTEGAQGFDTEARGAPRKGYWTKVQYCFLSAWAIIPSMDPLLEANRLLHIVFAVVGLAAWWVLGDLEARTAGVGAEA